MEPTTQTQRHRESKKGSDMIERTTRTALILCSLSLCVSVVSPLRAAGKLEFNRDIRPILVENCFACHGPDKNARKAGLRLDVREEAVGMEAIVPGKPEKSHMTERIFS